MKAGINDLTTLIPAFLLIIFTKIPVRQGFSTRILKNSTLTKRVLENACNGFVIVVQLDYKVEGWPWGPPHYNRV